MQDNISILKNEQVEENKKVSELTSELCLLSENLESVKVELVYYRVEWIMLGMVWRIQNH